MEFEEQRRVLEDRRQFVDSSIEHSNKIQEETNNTQKSMLEINRKNYELSEQLAKLVAENKEKENILLAREQNIKDSEDYIEERKKEVRKEEIFIEARKSEIRKKEQEVSDNERDVKEREVEAERVKSESEQAKEKYQLLFDELEEEQENIKNLKKEAKRKNNLATEKENSANAIFEKAKIIDDEIKTKESEFEAKREEIESALKAKIEEYDRKLEDINNVQEFIDDIKFDDSEDGKAAKIVVKEAIRQAKKSLSDIKTQFDELDEKYCSGTFKGFSTPISEIDKSFEELKTQYQQIKEHIEANDSLPESINKWLDNIESYINNADKSNKSWEFSEAYRNIVFGLSTCKSYELLLTILNEWGNSETNDEENNGQEEEFNDWYEILGLNPDATKAEIKKKYKELMKKYHPDKNQGNSEYNEMAQKIIEANRILCDDEKRKEFDEKRKKHKG
ncbi:MAG: DnaJ domain-containing protein [Helicobacteraceae bacterium]|nr:DnaJ domain-containing protein [Helicobacteraceae bacterium]